MPVRKRAPTARRNVKGGDDKKAIALKWYLENIRGLVPGSDRYNNELSALVKHGNVDVFVRMYKDHRNDNAWIERQRQYETADSKIIESYDNMVTDDMATQRFKESGGR